MSLEKFVKRENFFNNFYRRPLIDIKKLTQEEAAVLFRKLDSNMSPENLYVNGALDAMAVERVCTQAFADLKALGFSPPENLCNLRAFTKQ